MTVTVYRIYDAEDGLLYVGITGGNVKRLHQHRRDKPWWESAARIELVHFATREEAMRAEREAIQTERPVHNIHHAELVPANYVRMTVRLPLEIFEELQSMADREGVSLNSYITEIVREHVRTYWATHERRMAA